MSPRYYSIVKFNMLTGYCCRLILYDKDKRPYRQNHINYQGSEEQVDKKIAEWKKKYKSLTYIPM